MSTKSHAQRELELAGLFDKDSDYDGALGSAVMELVEVFGKQGHSGASAHRVIGLFKEVALYNCLTPLIGNEDEWNDISDLDGGTLQNNRVSSVFKEKDSGKSYFLDAITWRSPIGTTWSGSAQTKEGKKVYSRQYIKSFPFQPKRFYVDITEEEVGKDNWVFTVRDNEQLAPVFEYYEEYK